jgi:hypothetical protein
LQSFHTVSFDGHTRVLIPLRKSSTLQRGV